jgi:hypothetical protein
MCQRIRQLATHMLRSTLPLNLLANAAHNGCLKKGKHRILDDSVIS